jgi:hypothetical protein
MDKSEQIFAIINKPVGRGNNRYWKAFGFNSNANQSDVEAFMCSIHISVHDYFLIMRSNLESKKPCHGSSNQRTIYYYTSNKYGRIFVNETPVSLSWEKRKENGYFVKNRIFKVR